MGFESLRKQGSDPAFHMPTQYKTIHSEHSIEPSPNVHVVENLSKEDVGNIIEQAKAKVKLNTEASAKNVTEAVKAFKDKGMIAGDDWVKESQERDKKIAEQENAPIDTSGMKFAKLDDKIV